VVNSIRIWEIPGDHSVGLPPTDVVQRIESGDVLLIRRAFQQVGLWDDIQETLWGAFEEALGHDTAGRLRGIGLESMHQLLTGEQIKRCNELAHLRLNSITRSYVPRLVRNALGYSGPGFYDQNSVIRFYVPIAFHKSNREILDARPGYTKPQGPHVDTWFGHATSGIVSSQMARRDSP